MGVKVIFDKSKHVFKSLSELGNYVKAREAMTEEDRKKEADPKVSNDCINDMTDEGQLAFIDHALKCLKANLSCPRRFEFAQLLELRARKWKIEQIAQFFKVPIDVVEYMEKEALKWALESIEAVTTQGIPIIGGKPGTVGGSKLIFT